MSHVGFLVWPALAWNYEQYFRFPSAITGPRFDGGKELVRRGGFTYLREEFLDAQRLR
jgi:hypothetical protein